jgi:uncharacterized cupin superfamily protein
VGTSYPSPYDAPCAARVRHRLGDAAGLTDFGVNLLRLPPGTWSSQRHWHAAEDEFVYILEGEVVLVTDVGEETLRAGDCAGFKAGIKDGHHLQNRSPDDALLLEVGSRKDEDAGEYRGHRHALLAGWLHAQGRHALSGKELVSAECPGHRARAYGTEPRIAAQVRDAPKSSAPRRTRCPRTWCSRGPRRP